jgi:protein SCO1
MRRHIRAKSATVAVLLLVSTLLAFRVGSAAAAPHGVRWGADYFPNVRLVTQTGQTVRFYDDLLKGKTVVVDVIYTHCTNECPLETARLVQVQKLLADRMGKDVFFYSITIDPRRDTPAVLEAYAQRFHVGPGWLFLTGEPEDIKLVTRKLGLSSLTDSQRRDGHIASLMIGNEATGQWMRNSALDNPRFLAVKVAELLPRKPGSTAASYADAPRLPELDAGAYLFRTRCSACHTIGQGDGVGPDLLGVTNRRGRAWLLRWLAAPDRMLAEGDPVATALLTRYRSVPMPNLRLGEADMTTLLSYLEARAASAPRHETGQAPRRFPGE